MAPNLSIMQICPEQNNREMFIWEWEKQSGVLFILNIINYILQHNIQQRNKILVSIK